MPIAEKTATIASIYNMPGAIAPINVKKKIPKPTKADSPNKNAVFLTTPLTVIGTAPTASSVRLIIGFAIVFL